MTQRTVKKIVTNVGSLKLQIDALRAFSAMSQKVGLICGTFDLLHDGHTSFINGASQECDLLIAMVNSDKRVKRKKGNSRPIWPQQERANKLAEIDHIDSVFTPLETNPSRAFHRASFLLANLAITVKPDIIFVGSDYSFPITTALSRTSRFLPTLIKINAGANKPHTSDLLATSKPGRT